MRDAADGDRDDAEGGGGQGKWEGRVPRTGRGGLRFDKGRHGGML